MSQVIIALIAMTSTGLLLGLIIGIMVKFFSTSEDPRHEQILGQLSGANCGGCGFAGCADFARALIEGRALANQCPGSSAETIQRIAKILGVKAEASEPKVAYIRCQGDITKTTQFNYNGIADCRAAQHIAGGFKSCSYGCLGLGTCLNICPFHAIYVGDNGLPIVDKNKCTGCKKCIEACPRNLITLVPKSATLHVACNNPTRGAEKTKACKIACVGCRKCSKTVPDTITFNEFVAVVDYSKPMPQQEDAERLVNSCPFHCIVKEPDHE